MFFNQCFSLVVDTCSQKHGLAHKMANKRITERSLGHVVGEVRVPLDVLTCINVS